MRLLVCGGRNFGNPMHVGHTLAIEHRMRLFAALDWLHARKPISCVIHGMAVGADTLAGEWAAARGVLVDGYKAEWNTFGSAGGPLRNSRMLRKGKPDAVLAFPGGPGTAHMKRIARAAGVPIVELN